MNKPAQLLVTLLIPDYKALEVIPSALWQPAHQSRLTWMTRLAGTALACTAMGLTTHRQEYRRVAVVPCG
ncbi:hypothetical protein PROAA_2720002 [Candidatus Propionivibrio aalborgensis]|uniref:Uncharacterized protein n=1 Tax=Candidatus Propionivibrio aalborgensis TaxID=1860101 RepID=A0A1A8XUY7_9RHOO|nr:hypothetical protein [Candidatus Propionivibrio aalborgensis]SBT08392.1 hypothetical protein PROAA_2720002 [Candidatus Propionivibrio aalborgensis]